MITRKPTEFFHRKEPSAAGAATKKELEVKNRLNHEAHEEHEERSNVTANNLARQSRNQSDIRERSGVIGSHD